MSDKKNNCSLCGREAILTFHHLIPRACHTNKWFKKNYSREELKGRGIDVCHDCHNFIHSQFGEKELGKSYNTRETLLKTEEVRKFVKWVRKKK
ncbi:MAG: hypothetical protein GY795_13165 [Desulfobacterales bacterium]|nr:hypothetical protein [Desulfobacterales bacterium]